jgi:putative membrane protein (TIGR04086 family)
LHILSPLRIDIFKKCGEGIFLKKQENGQKETKNVWLCLMSAVLKGGILGVFILSFALFLGSFLVFYGVIPERWLDGTALGCCVLASLLGGGYAVRRTENYPFAAGLGVGAALFFLLLTAGLIAYGGTAPGESGPAVLCACLCGGGLSGILRKKGKKKHRR